MSLTRSMKAQNWQTLLTLPVGHTTTGNYIQTQPLISSELCPSVGIIVALTHFLCVWISPTHVVLLHVGGKRQAKRRLLWAARIAPHGTPVLQEVLGSSVGLCSFWPPHQGRGEVRARVWQPTTVIVLGASQCAKIHAVVKYCLQILQCASRVAYEQNESQKKACSW